MTLFWRKPPSLAKQLEIRINDLSEYIIERELWEIDLRFQVLGAREKREYLTRKLGEIPAPSSSPREPVEVSPAPIHNNNNWNPTSARFPGL